MRLASREISANRFEVLGDVIEVRKILFRMTKGDAKHKRFLAWAHIFYGEAMLDDGESARALELFKEAHGLMREVLINDPNSVVAQKDMAWAEGHFGDALIAVGRTDDAIAGYDRALKIARVALENDVTSLARRRNVAYWLIARGKALRIKGEIDLARTDIDQAIEFLRSDTKVDLSNRQLRAELGGAYLERGRVFARANEPELASEFFMKAKATFEAIAAEVPGAKIWIGMTKVADREFIAICQRNNAGACTAGWSGRAAPTVLEPPALPTKVTTPGAPVT